jgi:hypothetical protein
MEGERRAGAVGEMSGWVRVEGGEVEDRFERR